MRAKPFLIGLSAGIIGGIATAIFTTPQTGDHLRKNIVNNAKNAKVTIGELGQQIDGIKNAVSTFKYEVQNTIPKIFNDLANSISNYKAEIQPESQKLKEELEQLQNSINEIENNLSKITKEKNVDE